MIRHLEDLLQSARVMPALNQVEFHPRLPQPKLHAFCDEHDIRLQAWRPLMKGQVLEIPELIHLGEKHGKSPIQVTLRWMLQKRVLSLARSSQKEHIEHNADVFDFELDPDEVAIIDGLDRSKRLGPHPDEFTASP